MKIRPVFLLLAFVVLAVLFLRESRDVFIENIGVKRQDIPLSSERAGLTVDQYLPNHLALRVHGKGKTVIRKIQQAITYNRLAKVSCEGCFSFQDHPDSPVTQERCLEHDLPPQLRESVLDFLSNSVYDNVDISVPNAMSFELYSFFGFRPGHLNIQLEGEVTSYRFLLKDQDFIYHYAENTDDNIEYSFSYHAPRYTQVLASLNEYCLPYTTEMLTEENIKANPSLRFLYYSHRLKQAPDNVDALYQRGLAALNYNNHRQAKEDFTRVLKLRPDHAEASLRMAMAISDPYGGSRNNLEALAHLNKAIELSPGNAAGYIERGKVYRYLSGKENALDDFTRAITLRPDDPDAYFQRGELYRNDIKDPRSAVADYSRAIALDPDHFPAYSGRAGIYQAMGNYEAAIADQTALMRRPYNYWGQIENRRAELYVLAGQSDKAIADYMNLLENNKNPAPQARASIFLKIITIYLETGQYDQAVKTSTRSLDENPPAWDQVELYARRAVAYYYLNEFDKSWDDINRIKVLGGKFKYDQDQEFLIKLRNASGRQE